MKKLLLLLAFIGFLPSVSQAQVRPRPGRTAGVDSLVVDSDDGSSLVMSKKEIDTVLGLRKNKDLLLSSRTTEFKATVLNTNFVVPIIRFNKVNDAGATNNQRGNVSFFNSIGAGVSINRGRLELTTDDAGKVINTEMHNTIGLQVGLLFAANTGNDNNANIFAPTLSLSVLNFQIGVGHELGSLPENTDRTFYTVAYAIPIAKLVKGGFYVLKGVPATDQVQQQGQGTQQLIDGKKNSARQMQPKQGIRGFY